MDVNILLGIAAIFLPVLTYFAGVKRTERRLSDENQNRRIQAVVNKYIKFRESGQTSGYDGFVKSGAATLASDTEIREAADQIMAHDHKDPLCRGAYNLENVDLKIYFDFVRSNKGIMTKMGPEEIVESSGARR